jgi:2-keto-3-deoxy-L-rhamnonate aldolase RhmA
MRRNTVKEKIKNGQPAYGIWPHFPTPDRIELYGHLGYEFIIIDAEHLPITPERCAQLVRASDLVNLVPIVRPPGHLSSTILPYLETGAMGIYAPHVRSAADAKAIVDAVKYAPLGNRSAGAERPADYGLTEPPEKYYESANANTLVVLLVEDTEGVSNLDEILQVPEVDVVCIGPGDLSLSMGLYRGRSDPELMKAVREAEARIAAAGKPFDCEPTNAEEARAAIERGARLIPFFEGNMLVKLFRGVMEDLSSQ